MTNKEWIVDKKGRRGYLIKRKNTYLFQPLEIKDENASIFERTSYIDNKWKSIPIEIPKDPIISVKSKVSSSINTNTNNKNPWHSLQKIMDIVLSETSYIKPIVQNTQWFHYAKLAYRICVYKHNISVDTCKKYIVYHYLDGLLLDEKVWFLNNIYSATPTASPFKEYVSTYFQYKMNENKTYILLYDKSKSENQVFVLKKDTQWKIGNFPAGQESWLKSFEYKTKLIEHINIVLPKIKGKKELHIGFMNVFKENMEFKIKNLFNTRQNVGASCFQTNKKNLIDKVNELLLIFNKPESEKYSSDPVFTTTMVERPNLCLVYEFLLRYYTEENRHKNHIWFLNPEEATATQIDTFVAIPQTIHGETRYILKEK